MRLPRTTLWKAGIAAIVSICAVEVVARLSGITDFAVYAVDSDMGYIVKPSQSGTFLHKNSWAFNSKSMPTTEEWNPNLRPNVLLIGNSILMGGNPYDQKDKVTPLLMRDTANKYSIWPVAIGGWSNVNEVAYLRRNPDVVKAADFFVWEYMSGGLSCAQRMARRLCVPQHASAVIEPLRIAPLRCATSLEDQYERTAPRG